MTTTVPTPNPRVQAIFDDVQAALLEIITRHRVSWDEFRIATEWLTAAGRTDFEIPLMLDVFLSPTVDDLAHADAEGTESNVEGPFYIADAPLLERPYVLPQRADEPGEKLIFSGTVRSTDGTPLAGAVVDVWQANGAGEYSHFHPGVPEHNLRGRLTTDADGAFEFATVFPSSYGIPDMGATGQLLGLLGRHANRPGHVHLKVTHPDAVALTTQIYFDGDPYLDSDVVGAVKDSLIVKAEWQDDARGRSYAGCTYDIVLPRA
jgi:catechol 1,2-dioxygenase